MFRFLGRERKNCPFEVKLPLHGGGDISGIAYFGRI
jgi:hypothetical protein